MSDDRQSVLRAIRHALAESAARDVTTHALPHQPSPRALPLLGEPDSAAPPHTPATADPLTRFGSQLAHVGGECTVVADEAEAAHAVQRILQRVAARRIAISDAPIVRRLLESIPGVCEFHSVDLLSRDDLFECDVGVTTAQWAIAETGTLVLESARERSRLASLLPVVHIALLTEDRIRDSLGDVLAELQHGEDPASLASRAITFITGPSRTSDIELTLTVGVHGPQQLHVIVLAGAADHSMRSRQTATNLPSGMQP